MLTSGGDRRIAVPRGGNTNMYGASPYPRSTLGYASSTANDISLDAFRHLESTVSGWPAAGLIDAKAYHRTLEDLRHRIRRAWGLSGDVAIVFAASGTDLEYVALSLAAARSRQPVTNVLLGRDEVGSGCPLAASGRYFATETALRGNLSVGSLVGGLEGTQLACIPVRDERDRPLSSMAAAEAISAAADSAVLSGRHTLAHVVHGSKTGLVLPAMSDIDKLRQRHGEELSFVVDACQARITPEHLRAYLDRDAIVLLTGSKFMGGPPFSGFALVPASWTPPQAAAAGLASIFRRAEWPGDWSACDGMEVSANPGLLLRLEAAVFELERFNATPVEVRNRVIWQFGAAIGQLSQRLGADLVEPSLAGADAHLATLATLDLSRLASRPDLATAQRWWRVLAARGLRLGQPVKCVRREDGAWAGTLRLSLSMPLISSLSKMDRCALDARFSGDMAQIANVLEAAQRAVAA